MKSWFATVAVLAAALSFTMPATPARAAMAAPVAAESIGTGKDLTEQARWRGGGRGFRRGFYRPARFHRPWRPAYRPMYYRPRPYYIAPPAYGPRVVCRIRHRQVWNGWGYVFRPVRVCRRVW